MIARQYLFLTPIFAALAGLAQAQPAPAAVQSEGISRDVVCNNAQASIGGSRNTITFTGSCTGLQIRGEENRVSVTLAPGSLIDIEGTGNHVQFASTVSPRLRVSGNLTEVKPNVGSAAPAADTASLSGNSLTLELDCAGKSVTLQGTRSTIRLRGACSALTVRGEANRVHADLAANASVLVEGNGISLVYTVAGDGVPPAMSVRGMGSSVTREGGQTPPVVLPTGVVASVPLLMRDLDGVVVRAGTVVKLPVAVFNGPLISPAGETQLARLATLIGLINPSGLRITGQGPEAAIATQRAERVHDWLTGHGLPKLPVKLGQGSGTAGVDVLILR